jgi:hypothetical protein
MVRKVKRNCVATFLYEAPARSRRLRNFRSMIDQIPQKERFFFAGSAGPCALEKQTRTRHSLTLIFVLPAAVKYRQSRDSYNLVTIVVAFFIRHCSYANAKSVRRRLHSLSLSPDGHETESYANIRPGAQLLVPRTPVCTTLK